MKKTVTIRGRKYWRSARELYPCWYNCDRKCTQPRDCKIAGQCLDCWNPARSEAIRRGAGGSLWVWAVR